MQTKLFLGTRLNPELKEAPFQTIPHEGKLYVGFYLPEAQPTMHQIRAHCDHFLQKIQETLPALRPGQLSIVIFPQRFIG